MDFTNTKLSLAFLCAALTIPCVTSCQLPDSGETPRKQLTISIPDADLFAPVPTASPGAFFVADKTTDSIHFIQVDWDAKPASHTDKAWAIPEGEGRITAMDISPDDHWLAVVTNNPANLYLLDTRTSKLDKMTGFGNGTTTSIAFGADGTVYVGAFGVDGVAHIRTFTRNAEDAMSEGPRLSKSDGYIVGRSPRYTTIFTSDQPQQDPANPSVTQWSVSQNPAALISSYPYFGNGADNASKIIVAPVGDILLGLTTTGSKSHAGHFPRYRQTGATVEELPYLFPEYTPTAAAFAPSGERVVVAHHFKDHVNSFDGVDRHEWKYSHLHVFDATTANDVALLRIPGEAVRDGLFLDVESNIYVLIGEIPPLGKKPSPGEKPSQQIYAMQP